MEVIICDLQFGQDGATLFFISIYSAKCVHALKHLKIRNGHSGKYPNNKGVFKNETSLPYNKDLMLKIEKMEHRVIGNEEDICTIFKAFKKAACSASN